MTRLVVSVLTSLDGYFQGLDGDLSVMPFEDASNTHNLGLLQTAGTLVYGSTWFTENWDFWSTVAADTSANEREHGIAHLVMTLPKLVISDSITEDPDAPWAQSTRIIPRVAAPAELAHLKKQGDGDLVMFGSATTWGPLLEQGSWTNSSFWSALPSLERETSSTLDLGLAYAWSTRASCPARCW